MAVEDDGPASPALVSVLVRVPEVISEEHGRLARRPARYARARVPRGDPEWLRALEREVLRAGTGRAGRAGAPGAGELPPPALRFYLAEGAGARRRLRGGRSLLRELGARGAAAMSNLVVHAEPARAGLRGGGGDGGSTGAEDRKAYLEMHLDKRERAKADRSTASLNRYTSCAVSGAQLRADAALVVDAVGQLIDKEALLRRMLDGTLQALPGFGHVRSLKDVRDVTLTPAPAGGGFCCPVLGLPLNGRFRFCLLKRHGVLVSERSLRDAREAVEEAVGATLSVRREDDGSGAFKETDDLLTMYPSEELAEERRARAVERRQREKLAKKLAKKADGGGDRGPRAAGGGKRKAQGGADGPAKRRADKGRGREGDSEVYRSIFHSGGGGGAGAETFTARSMGARGLK